MSARDSALGSNLGLRISSTSYDPQPSGRGSREADLMAGFQELKRAVRDVEGMLTRRAQVATGAYHMVTL